jgi:hypothetical protein
MDQRIPIVSFRDRPLLIPWWRDEMRKRLEIMIGAETYLEKRTRFRELAALTQEMDWSKKEVNKEGRYDRHSHCLPRRTG